MILQSRGAPGWYTKKTHFFKKIRFRLPCSTYFLQKKYANPPKNLQNTPRSTQGGSLSTPRQHLKSRWDFAAKMDEITRSLPRIYLPDMRVFQETLLLAIRRRKKTPPTEDQYKTVKKLPLRLALSIYRLTALQYRPFSLYTIEKKTKKSQRTGVFCVQHQTTFQAEVNGKNDCV